MLSEMAVNLISPRSFDDDFNLRLVLGNHVRGQDATPEDVRVNHRAHARRDAIHLRPTGEHAHDTHAPAEGGEGEEEAQEAEGHGGRKLLRNEPIKPLAASRKCCEKSGDTAIVRRCDQCSPTCQIC